MVRVAKDVEDFFAGLTALAEQQQRRGIPTRLLVFSLQQGAPVDPDLLVDFRLGSFLDRYGCGFLSPQARDTPDRQE